MLYPIVTRTRTLLSLNGIWGFSIERNGHSYKDGFVPEKLVAVPASYNDQFVDEKIRTCTHVWYEKRFDLPMSLAQERLTVRFGSVNYRADVFLNGIFLGSHETGYTPFEYELGSSVRWDASNVLSVRVENLLSAETVPMGNLSAGAEHGQIVGQYPNTPFDFFPYAGIHRAVVICSTSRIAWLDSIKITTKRILDHIAEVSIEGRTGGDGYFVSLIIDGSEEETLLPVNDRKFSANMSVKSPILWDMKNPHLYQVSARVLDENKSVVDVYKQDFGIRTVSIRNNRFCLNDRPVYLKGFGRHEDFPVIGKGTCDALNIRDHELLRWVNANSYRTAHYPYSEDLIKLADRQGILLIGETPGVSINTDFATERTLEIHKKTLEELIERDYNSPAVIMWSVGNEATTDRPEAESYFKSLAQLSKTLDPNRPVTMVTCKPLGDCVGGYFDIVSLNTYPGWYWLPGQIEAAKKDLKDTLSLLYEKFDKPIFIAELGADSIAGFHSLPAEQWSEEYQSELIIELLKVVAECNFVVGEHIWSFADFRTSQNFSRAGGNKKGVFTRDRQPKLAAHFLKKYWEETAVVN